MVVASTHGSCSAAGSYLKPRIHCSCNVVDSGVENSTDCECTMGDIDVSHNTHSACAVGGSCLNSSNSVNVLSETDHLYMDGVSHN